MIRQFTLCIAMAFCSVYATGQKARTAYNDREVWTTPEVSAKYPGGLEEFYKYVQQNLVYPVQAIKKNIEGVVYTEFVITQSGAIDPQSIRILSGLDPECDAEVIRVIRRCKAQWNPASINDKSVMQRLILPITFKLTDTPTTFHGIGTKPIRAVVGPKPDGARVPTWGVYKQVDMEILTGKLNIGDSVEVYGWAYNAYFIRTKTVSGYISWRALTPTNEIANLNKLIETESRIEDERKRQDDERKKEEALKRKRNLESKWEKTFSMKIEPTNSDIEHQKNIERLLTSSGEHVFLRVVPSKHHLLVGECTIIDINLYISMKNQLRLQFYDITKDITRWLVTDLQKDNVWGGITKIHDIKDEPISFNNNRYSVYKLYSTNFCPIEQMPIVIDTLSIGLAQLKPDVKTIEKLVRYTSKKIIIPVDKITSSNNHQLVGNFILTDSLAHKEIHVNEPVTYELTIQGEGLTFPLHAPELVLPGISATLIGIEHADTISESRYFSQKTFTYSLNFERPGTYDVSKTINFTTFNPSTHKAHPLTVNTIFNVSESKNSTKARNAIDYLLHKDNLIALDISKSMQIEDYSPNRLAAVKKGISNFLKIQNQCDIGMIIFGGDAKPYSIETQGSYYDLERINSLEYSMVTDGTAIGDAIWIAGSNFNESPKKKKLVIIGDGDNTAGQISPGAALRLLQNNNIVIYTIGIGSSGPVPFGKDQEGKPFMVSNTFSDLDFKAIARATGGKYYWAKDAESLTRILKEIFAE